MPHDDVIEKADPDTPSAPTPADVTWPGAEVTIVASMEGVRMFMEALADNLAPLGLDEDVFGNIQIVLAEVLNNVAEHAYAEAGQGAVTVSMVTDDGLLSVSIVDKGKSMPGLQLPEKRQAEIEVERQNLPEGGFGWFLIHELVEELSYSRRHGRNMVRIGISLEPPMDEPMA